MAADSARFRYRAFISYSHSDEAFSRRLHRRLEAYRPPRKALKGRANTRPSHARIRPVFRDQEELASSDSLSDAIQDALNASEVLIVLCSPASAKSRWVNEEIRYFRRAFPERKIFPIVIAGDPGADPRESPDTAAFPLAMLLTDVDDPDGPYREPLAADAREEADGFTIAFLKLVAGILKLPFDRLRQRDLRRRQRRLALGLMASIALSAIFAVMAWRAIVARDEAREARAQAELELLSEQQTRSFLLSVFRLADPGEARGNSVTVREVLDSAVARIDSTEFSRPVIRSRFLATMGEAYSSLGINKRSVELLEQSLAALPADLTRAEDRVQAAQSSLELADVYFDMGDYEQALVLLGAVDDANAYELLSPASQAYAANVRGDVLSYLEQDDAAMAQFRRALELADKSPLTGEQDASVRHRALGGIALLHHYAGDFSASQDAFKQAVDVVIPVFGEMHPDSIWALTSWGSAAYSNGDADAARDAWSRALDIAIKVLGERNPEVGTIKNNLARLALERGDFTTAELLYRDALAIDRAHRSQNFDDLAYPLTSLALARLAQGDPEEARSLLEEALAVAEITGHRMLGPMLTNLADIDCGAGRIEAGAMLAERAVPVTREEFGEDDWHTDQALLVRSWCRQRNGQEARADEAAAAADALADQWGVGHFFAQRALRQKAEITGRNAQQ